MVHNMMLAPRTSREKVFFHQTNYIPDVKFFDNLIGWTLAMQNWNRNRVYSSITPMLATLHWHQHHIVNQALLLDVLCVYIPQKLRVHDARDKRALHFTVVLIEHEQGHYWVCVCVCLLIIAELTFFSALPAWISPLCFKLWLPV